MASGETNLRVSTSDVAAISRSKGSLWWNGKVISGSMCRGSTGSNWMRFAANWAGNNRPNGAVRASFPMRTFKAISSKLMGDSADVGWILDRRFRVRTQLRIIRQEPKQGERVEQHVHSMYSFSSVSGSSKSSRTSINPLALPA